MHSPCFRFPPILKNFLTRFSSTKISDDPFSPVSVHFPPLSRKLLFPLLSKMSPCFRIIHLLFTYITCISFPPTLTMMHLCITQCTYWTPLRQRKTCCCPFRLSFVPNYISHSIVFDIVPVDPFRLSFFRQLYFAFHRLQYRV